MAPHEYGEGNFTGASGGKVVRGALLTSVGGAGWDRERKGAATWFRNERAAARGAGFRCARDDRELTQPPPGGFWQYDDVQWRILDEIGGGQ